LIRSKSGSTPLCIGFAALLGGCTPGGGFPGTRSDVLVDTALPPTVPPDATNARPPPGPLPGWQEERDGIVCSHPAVQADCDGGFCRIPPGCYVKGSPEEESPRRAAASEDQVAVILNHGFFIQQTEVTQREWTGLGLRNPSGPYVDMMGGGDCTDDPTCPVGHVTWFEAAQYANLLSATNSPPFAPCYVFEECTGEMGQAMACASAKLTAPTVYDCEGYRLPTDAEWEYAARAGTRTPFYSGEIAPHPAEGRCHGPDANLEGIAWYCNNSGRTTHPVRQKGPNSWMLYDMLGNVDEWQHNPTTGGAPPPGPLQDPFGNISQAASKMTRGGSVVSWPSLLRASSRLSFLWNGHSAGIGFRLVRSLPRTEGATPR
jgi:formylglycine-generating enzyme